MAGLELGGDLSFETEEGAGTIDSQIDQLYEFGTDASLDARTIADEQLEAVGQAFAG